MYISDRWTGTPIYIRSDMLSFATSYVYHSLASLKDGIAMSRSLVIKDGEQFDLHICVSAIKPPAAAPPYMFSICGE